MTLPTVRPARPAYPPPVPTGFIDPGGRTPVERAHRTQQAVAKAYSDWRAAHSSDISPEALRDNAGAFQVSDAAVALPDALAAVKDDADAATLKVNDLIKNQLVGGDVASQLAAQRYWDRSRRTPDSITNGAKAVSAAQDLIASASDSQVPVLADLAVVVQCAHEQPTAGVAYDVAGRRSGSGDTATIFLSRVPEGGLSDRIHHLVEQDG